MDEKRKEQFYQNIVYDVWKDTLQDNTFDSLYEALRFFRYKHH